MVSSRTALWGCCAALILAGLLPVTLSQPQAKAQAALAGDASSSTRARTVTLHSTKKARRSGLLSDSAAHFPSQYVDPVDPINVCNHEEEQAIPNPGFINLTETQCQYDEEAVVNGPPTFHVYGNHTYTGQLKMFLLSGCDPLFKQLLVSNLGSYGNDMNFVLRDDLPDYMSTYGSGLGHLCDAACEANTTLENAAVFGFKSQNNFTHVGTWSNAGKTWNTGLLGRQCCKTWTLSIQDMDDLDDTVQTPGQSVPSNGFHLHWSMSLPGCGISENACDENALCAGECVNNVCSADGCPCGEPLE